MAQVSMTVRMDSGIKAAPEKESPRALETFRALRAEAQENGLQEMTLDEINEEIRLAREERRAKMEKG